MLAPLSVNAAKKKSQPEELPLPELPQNAHIAVKVPRESSVVFHARVNYDRIDVGHGSFLYPAPDAASFIVGVLTHALLVGSMKDKKKQEKQRAADVMLTPYMRVIENFKYDDLLTNSISAYEARKKDTTTVTNIDAAPGDYVLESAPVFLMIPTEDALLVQNTVALYSSSDPQTLLYRNSVEIVSDSPAEAYKRSTWLENDGEKLKEVSTQLYAMSLEIILDNIFDRHPRRKMPQQTFRYFEGPRKKIERGELVTQDCHRFLMKTLWGTLKSAQIYQKEEDIEACLKLQ